jgi:hypothetical protein
MLMEGDAVAEHALAVQVQLVKEYPVPGIAVTAICVP